MHIVDVVGILSVLCAVVVGLLTAGGLKSPLTWLRDRQLRRGAVRAMAEKGKVEYETVDPLDLLVYEHPAGNGTWFARRGPRTVLDEILPVVTAEVPRLDLGPDADASAARLREILYKEGFVLPKGRRPRVWVASHRGATPWSGNAMAGGGGRAYRRSEMIENLLWGSEEKVEEG